MDSDTSRSMINLCDAAAAQDPLPVDAPPAVVSSSVAVKPEPLPEDYFKDVKFDDIVVTSEEVNPIKNPPKRKTINPPPIRMTRLKLIKNIPAASISTRDRRLIGMSLHITGYRDFSKLELFQKLVEMKDIYNEQKASGL